MSVQDRRAADEIARKFGDYEWGYSEQTAANLRANCADAIFDALQKAREEERPRWRSIETAPKDGTRILIASRFRGVEIVRWIGEPHSHWSIDGYRFVTDAIAWQPLPAAIRALPESEG